MNAEKYILVFDQGTTSSRAILMDHDGNILGIEAKEFEQIFPKPGWVEHRPQDIWQSQLEVARKLLKKTKTSASSITALGITNQRETSIVWERATGKPIANAIVWQDRRTAEYCDELKHKGLVEKIKKKTGLVPDAYFSATKIKWILDNIKGARKKADNGELAFGTVDSWIIWNLTLGKSHTTDASNASRTMLYNIQDLAWDNELLKLFDIPPSMLPAVKDSADDFGETASTFFGGSIPICGVAGDQQAALFGQMCTKVGMIKNTYGTGCFIMMNTGTRPIFSKNNLLSTIAWKMDGKATYALEGSIFIGGAVVQWLRDGLGIIKSSADVEKLAASTPDNGDVYLVPAFTGLGAPHWDQYARGIIVGITRGTTSAHIARAALEAIAFQTKDVLDAMIIDSDINAAELRVDGGATANDLLMQFQSDLLRIRVLRPKYLETTALGAGYLAGISSGYWKDINEIRKIWKMDRLFKPNLKAGIADIMLQRWHEAVKRSKNWQH